MTAAEYKDQFELPKRGLLSETALEKGRAHARHLLATDERVRNGLLLQRDRVLERERLNDARTAASQAARKAGVREILRHNGRHAAAVSAQARRDAHDRRAQQLGYTGVADMVKANVHLSNPELAELLGCSISAASKIRRNHGWPSQHVRHKQEQAQTAQDSAKRHEFELALGRVGDIVQPHDRWGRWLCRCCGEAAADLSVHLESKHQMTRGVSTPPGHPATPRAACATPRLPRPGKPTRAEHIA